MMDLFIDAVENDKKAQEILDKIDAAQNDNYDLFNVISKIKNLEVAKKVIKKLTDRLKEKNNI